MDQCLPPTMAGREMRARQAFTRLLLRYDQCIRDMTQYEVEEGNPDSTLYTEWQMDVEAIRTTFPVLAWVLGISPSHALLALDCIDGCVGRSSCLSACEEAYTSLLVWVEQGSDPCRFADIKFPRWLIPQYSSSH